jgi:hypothetical protein
LIRTRKIISEDQALVHFDFVIEVPSKKLSCGKVKVKVFILFGLNIPGCTSFIYFECLFSIALEAWGIRRLGCKAFILVLLFFGGQGCFVVVPLFCSSTVMVHKPYMHFPQI